MRKVISKKKGRVGTGNPRRPDPGTVQHGAWKWKHMHKAGPELGRDPMMKTGEGRREQESNWWMMVNLNKQPKSDTEAKLMVAAMSHALTRIKSRPALWGQIPDKSIFIWGPNVGHVTPEARKIYQRDGRQPSRYIKELKIEAPRAEIGPVRKRLHAHFQLYVTHYSSIHLNTRVFAQVFKELYNEHMRENGVTDPKQGYIAEGKGPLIWARLSPQKGAHKWMHLYAQKAEDE